MHRAPPGLACKHTTEIGGFTELRQLHRQHAPPALLHRAGLPVGAVSQELEAGHARGKERRLQLIGGALQQQRVRHGAADGC